MSGTAAPVTMGEAKWFRNGLELNVNGAEGDFVWHAIDATRPTRVRRGIASTFFLALRAAMRGADELAEAGL